MPEVLVEAGEADGSNNAVAASLAANVQLKPDMESRAHGSDDVFQVQTPLVEVEEPKQFVQPKSGSSNGFLAVVAPLAEPH